MPTIEFAVKCHKCGTVLTGLDSAGACPFCQRRIAETVDDRLLDVASGVVNVDLTCTTCAYNLRTMPFDAVCPECAAPVVNSLRVEEIRFCDPNWLRTIRKGLDIVVASAIVSIVLGIVFTAFFMFQTMRSGGALPSLNMTLMVIPNLCMYALLVWGVFCLTSPKADEPADDRINRIGRWARILMIVALCISLLTIFSVADVNTLATGSFSVWRTVPGVLANVLTTACAICALVSLGRIATLGRRPGLNKLGKWLSWLLGVQMVVGVAAGIVVLLLLPSIVGSMPGFPYSVATGTKVGPGGASVSTTVTAVMGPSVPPPNSPTNPTSTGSAAAPEDAATTPAEQGGTLTIPAAQGGAPGSVAAPSGAPAIVAAPIPTGFFAGSAVFGCVSGSISLAILVLGIIAISKYRKLLTSAIEASVAAAPVQPPV